MAVKSWYTQVTKDYAVNINQYSSVASTNEEAAKLARRKVREWTVVWSMEQTAGRGRYQRRWESPYGAGLWFSIILRPEIELQYLNLINLGTAVIVGEFITGIMNTWGLDPVYPVELKWPNDVLVNGKKICGILLESELSNDKLNYLVVGIGININQTVDDFPESLQNSAISLRMTTGKKWELKELLEQFLGRYYRTLQDQTDRQFRGLVHRYQKYMAFKNHRVSVRLHHRTVTGKLRGINEFGHLILQVKGQERIITTGDLWNITDEGTV